MQTKTAKENDGKDIIYRYLKSRNIDSFKMTGTLEIEGKVINVSFLLKDKNLMITYLAILIILLAIRVFIAVLGLLTIQQLIEYLYE